MRTDRTGDGGRWRAWVAVAAGAAAMSLAAVASAAPKPPGDLPTRGPKVNERLAAKLAKLGPHETIPVSIWLNIPDPPLERPLFGWVGQEGLDAHLEQVRAFVAPKRRGVVNAIERMGARATEPMYAPAVFATLPPGLVRALEKRDDVAAIYGPEEYGPLADDASTTERAYPVWALGNLGAGTRPVVHEGEGVSSSNIFLNNSTHPVFFWCSAPASYCTDGKFIGDHPTIVAGEIAATHPRWRGIAPSAAAILSANVGDYNSPAFDTRAVQAIEWARGNGGDPVNMSWGTFCGGFQTFFSRYVDWYAKNLAGTVVIAAGNHPTPCGDATNDEKVSAPGVAWSAITVGNHTDNNNGFWSGDAMAASSDWRNPDFATGMEKPEVSAVGTDIASTDNQGGDHIGFGWTGTSMAAPQVAGQVASMLFRKPGQTGWPETNKAAVLASAYHDIEAGTSRDGVGSVVMTNSDDTYRFNRFINTTGNATAGNFPKNFPVSFTANQRVRIAIAWDSWSTGGAGTDTLGADIDLHVLNPSNTIIASSSSVQNAWEVVEFTAPVTGTYTIRLVLFSSEANWPGTFIGVAWSIRSLPNFCTGMKVFPATGGSWPVNTANGPTFFDSYSSWGFDQSGREAVGRIVLSTTKDITFTDTNANLDLHVMQFPNCAADPIVPTMRGSGANSVFINNAAAGTYYLVADGRSGAVGTSTAQVTISGP